MTLTGEQITHLVDVLAPVALAVVGLIKASRAERAARDAQAIARAAHRTARQVQSDQVHMALRATLLEPEKGS